MISGISVKTLCASGLVIGLGLAAHGDQGAMDQRIEDIVTLIEEMDPAAFTVPANDQTRHFVLADGGLGQLAKAKAPGATGGGSFMLEATAGAALVQDYQPTGGPDCDVDASG